MKREGLFRLFMVITIVTLTALIGIGLCPDRNEVNDHHLRNCTFWGKSATWARHHSPITRGLRLAADEATEFAQQIADERGGFDEGDFVAAIGAFDQDAATTLKGAALTHRLPRLTDAKLKPTHRAEHLLVVVRHARSSRWLYLFQR
jgi:hypothetical protein